VNEASNDYWQEAFMLALESMDRFDIVESMTPEQLKEMGEALSGSYENYGDAFYSPPASDRINDIERHHKARFAALQREFDDYRANAETAVKQALRQPSDADVSIGKYGEVTRYGGRSERIQ